LEYTAIEVQPTASSPQSVVPNTTSAYPDDTDGILVTSDSSKSIPQPRVEFQLPNAVIISDSCVGLKDPPLETIYTVTEDDDAQPVPDVPPTTQGTSAVGHWHMATVHSEASKEIDTLLANIAGCIDLPPMLFARETLA
jgi:hypothetical protein